MYVLIFLKVNESRYKQCGVTLHFSTGQILCKSVQIRRIDISNSLSVICSQSLLLCFPEVVKITFFITMQLTYIAANV